MFSHVCIANRGEIAVRIARTCRRLGIRTHALYSDADAEAMHVRIADGATRLGPPPVADSYLKIEAVIDAALAAGCDAVHPGYGLLSENAAFARACRERGLAFVGPRAEHLELMGEKHRARVAMAEQGMPVIPGYDEILPDEGAFEIAKTLGFPLIIKASRGGGGIGMAVVHEPDQFERSLRRARQTAERSFGSGELYLERQIRGARHIELQVLGDGEGHVVIVGDRECSMQRRHQKVIEEAPAPSLDEATRSQLWEQVATAVGAVKYLNAGTVECLVDADQHAYFLEMNTRLQVEHPVTEMVTGIDLVEWQLRIAAGETLAEWPDPPERGHAIEARIYAEDPETLMPAPGIVERIQIDQSPSVRLDSGVEDGDAVSAFYDPLIAKLIVHADDREDAVRKLSDALEKSDISGLTHNIPFLQRVVSSAPFVAGQYSVTSIQELIAAWQASDSS